MMNWLNSKLSIVRFWNEDNGAASVDFVVVTAAALILALTAGSMVGEGSAQMAENLGNHLSDTEVGG